MKLEGEIKCEGFEEWTQGEAESLGAFSLLITAGVPVGLKDSQGSFTELRGLAKPQHDPGLSTGSAGTTGASDN